VTGEDDGRNRRILVVDDNREVHRDFRKVLCPERLATLELDALTQALFGEPQTRADREPSFTIDSAYQGQEALERATESLRTGRPYALAFVDMRMPPGWDGVETIAHLWSVDPYLQIVICSAYSDYSWREIVDRLGQSDALLILKKPFDAVEVTQVASAFCKKWCLHRQARRQTEDLQAMVALRTRDLEDVNRRLREEMGAKGRMESALRLSQKLEAVGRLAAGVAHELNTPIQFAGDNLQFIREAMNDLARVLDRYDDLHRAVLEGLPPRDIASAVAQLLDEVEIEYLLAHVPVAIDRSLDGIGRAANIVRSMKQLAHPDRAESSLVDLNEAIRSTLTIAGSEYKFVADVETDFGDIPGVVCHAGEINQAVFNIVVNGAHAIADRVKGTHARGVIAIRTRRDGDHVLVSIQDTGGGIPAEIRDRIFDPFFTTKEVGRGTGQGLAIARSAVVERHGGELTFETEPGRGTTFFLRLPIAPAALMTAAAPAFEPAPAGAP
jgi:two-component system, NtrC family, sensor kinase